MAVRLYPVAGLYADLGSREHNIHARSELDQSHTLASRQGVTDFLIQYNTARHQTGDLFKDHTMPCPSIVTIFCSLRSAEARAIALPNLPL